jgi:hypothetical protein
MNDAKQEDYYFATCSERLYPNLPSPPIPYTVPLASHTGTFRDEGYGEFDVLLNCGGSEADTTSSSTTDSTCHLQVKQGKGSLPIADVSINLEHKSGDYWLAWIELWDTGRPFECVEAQFRVDAQGIVTHLGLNARMENGVPLIWFKRV